MDSERWHSEHGSVESVLSSAKQLAENGEMDAAYAVLTKFLRTSPHTAEALRMRAKLSGQLENWGRAVTDYNKAISLQPNCADCYFERGTAFLRSGDVQAAIDDFSTCLSMEPRHAPALASRAAMLLQIHHLEEALDDMNSAIAVRPLSDRDIHNRAVVLTHMGRIREAICEYERVLELNPDSGGTHNNLAWLLATSKDSSIRDGKLAVEHALRAVELGRTGAWLDTLAAAYAECGNFEAAIAAEEEAQRLSESGNPAFLKRLKMYRRGLSYANWLRVRIRNEDV